MNEDGHHQADWNLSGQGERAARSDWIDPGGFSSKYLDCLEFPSKTLR
jgi:hypothetical protein